MTKEIVLTRGKVAIVDDCDYERVAAFKWYACRSPRSNGDEFWYAHKMMPGRKNHERAAIPMHRFILDAPKGLVVDHIDGNGLNNTRANIRLCSHAENMRNLRLRSDSKNPYKGVQWREHAQAYGARLSVGGKIHWLGYFKNAKDAAKARDAAAIKLHGEFARLNFPKGTAK